MRERQVTKEIRRSHWELGKELLMDSHISHKRVSGKLPEIDKAKNYQEMKTMLAMKNISGDFL